jgi:hypothetical protein
MVAGLPRRDRRPGPQAQLREDPTPSECQRFAIWGERLDDSEALVETFVGSWEAVKARVDELIENATDFHTLWIEAGPQCATQ